MRRVEKPTRVWPDTHTSGPTHGPPAGASFSFASRESKISVCVRVYVYTRSVGLATCARARMNAHRFERQYRNVTHATYTLPVDDDDDDEGDEDGGAGGGGGVGTMTSHCRHPTHVYIHLHEPCAMPQVARSPLRTLPRPEVMFLVALGGKKLIVSYYMWDVRKDDTISLLNVRLDQFSSICVYKLGFLQT